MNKEEKQLKTAETKLYAAIVKGKIESLAVSLAGFMSCDKGTVLWECRSNSLLKLAECGLWAKEALAVKLGEIYSAEEGGVDGTDDPSGGQSAS